MVHAALRCIAEWEGLQHQSHCSVILFPDWNGDVLAVN